MCTDQKSETHAHILQIPAATTPSRNHSPSTPTSAISTPYYPGILRSQPDSDSMHILRKVPRLPPAILVEIFLCRFPTPLRVPSFGFNDLWDLPKVCSEWREIVVRISSLWCNLRVELSAAEDGLTNQIFTAVKKAFDRNATSPISLDITMSIIAGRVDPVKELVIPYSPRLRRLAIALPQKRFAAFFRLPGSTFGCLKSIKLHPHESDSPLPDNITVFNGAHDLRILTLETFSQITGLLPSIPWGQLSELRTIETFISNADIHVILEECSNLVVCDLAILPDIPGYDPRNKVILPHLKTLRFDTQNAGAYGDVVRPLVLPALKELDISSSFPGDWSKKELKDLVSRSTCALQHFKGDKLTYDVVVAFLENVPTLLELSMETADPPPVSMLHLMSDGIICPNLIRFDCSIEREMFHEFLATLESRVAQKGTLRLSVISRVSIACRGWEFPIQDYQSRLRKLRKSGMKISITVEEDTDTEEGSDDDLDDADVVRRVPLFESRYYSGVEEELDDDEEDYDDDSDDDDDDEW